MSPLYIITVTSKIMNTSNIATTIYLSNTTTTIFNNATDSGLKPANNSPGTITVVVFVCIVALLYCVSGKSQDNTQGQVNRARTRRAIRNGDHPYNSQAQARIAMRNSEFYV